MSLFFTGIGEIYSGSPQRGIILALIRGTSLLAVPFYSMTNIKDSYLTEVFFTLLFFTFITLFSPFNALVISFKKKKIVITKLSSTKFIIPAIICNIGITALSMAVFFSFFTIKTINTSYPPIIEPGDIAVIKKSENRKYKRGEMLALQNEKPGLVRIIGIPGEKITYDKGRFSVEGSELFLSIFTEEELKQFSLTDFDVISETQGSFTYPVVQNRDKFKLDIVLNGDEYFSAPDDRNKTEQFSLITSEQIYGRLDGLLFSTKRVKFLIKPFSPAK